MRDRLFWLAMAIIGGGLAFLLLSGDGGTIMGIDADRFAQLVSLGALALVIGSSALMRNARGGDTTRNIALWLLIAVLLVGGYQYRYELQDIASRMTAGLVPGSPLSIGEDSGRATVMLDRMQNGHFEVGAKVDGADIRMLVDTGATSTVLTAADARRAGFDPDKLAYTIPIVTANGAARAARVTIDEIRLGPISRKRLPVMVAEGRQLDVSLLGMNFISTLSGFDIRGERLILRD